MFNTEVFLLLNLACVMLMLGLAQWVESRTGRIPNWLIAACLILGVVLCVGDGLLSVHLGGFVMASVIGFSHFICGIIPGGTAKLMIGVGTMVGPASPIGTKFSASFRLPRGCIELRKRMCRQILRGNRILLAGTFFRDQQSLRQGPFSGSLR